MSQAFFRILDLRKNPVTHLGLEDGEQYQDGKIVKGLQAKLGSLDNRVGLEVLELLIAAELTIPWQGIPVFAAKSRKGQHMSSGCPIPFPGIVESDHSSRLWKAASKVD